jgi:3-keto-5-aminohexanoate cleavage enzyme
MEKLIITAAVSGSNPMRHQNPNVPYSPAEIAGEALRSWRAGAAVSHIHVRDPKTGKPAFERSLFAEVVNRIRSESDMIINLTTSGFNISDPDVDSARLMPLELNPDMCSLDIGSLNFRGGRVFVNSETWVERAATAMREAGVKPEIETFDLGHIRQARSLLQRGLVAPPPYFQLCLGIPWGIDGTLESLMEMRRRLPEDCRWSALAAGRDQLPVNTMTILMGGHVRVGFEDNIYLSRGVKADSNARFVERIVNLAGILQRDVASCEEARGILGLPKKAEPRGIS